MKAIILPAFLLLASCSQNNKEAEAQQVQQAAPETKKETAYLQIDTTLLASEKDPVCGMKIKNKVADTVTYDRQLYGFCGTGCKDAFIQAPLSYLKPAVK